MFVTFRTLNQCGICIPVMASTESQDGYERFLTPVNPVVRASLFAPFQPKGKDGALSLHQQALAAAIAFVTGTTVAGK